MTKQELIAELSRSRAAITRDFQAAQSALDVRARLAASFQSRPFAWLGGAAVAGWLAAGRRRSAKVRASGKDSGLHGKPSKGQSRGQTAPVGWVGLILGILRLAMPLMKPAFSAYAARRFAEMAEKLAKG